MLPRRLAHVVRWEGFVIEQILSVLTQCDCAFEAYFLRTSDQYEIDLLIDLGKARWAFEIKLSTSPSPHDFQRLNRAADLVGAERRFLVSQTRQITDAGKLVSCDLPWLLRHLEEQFA